MWHHKLVFLEELKRRRWPRWIRNAWLVFAFLGGSALVLHYPLKYFFPQALVAVWFMSVLITLFGFASLMLRFWHTYHDRTLRELEEEWNKRVPTIEIIGSYLHAGEKLQQEAKNPAHAFDNDFIGRLDEWHKHAASQLFQRLGEESKDAFYKGSKILEETPDKNGEFALWMHDRLLFLRTVMKDQKLLPDQFRKEACQHSHRVNESK